MTMMASSEHLVLSGSSHAMKTLVLRVGIPVGLDDQVSETLLT